MIRRSVIRGVLLAAFAGAPGAALAMDLTSAQADLYSSVSINPPSKSEMTVCYGFVCRRRMTLVFSDADRRTLTQILLAGKANAAAERIALQKAMVWFDRRVGPVIGTNKRVAKADIRAGSDATNFDCFDTTRDTTSLLLVLQEWGLLKFHKVGNPRYRGNPFALQTPHNTAVVVDKASRVEWVVDLWPKKYAEAPDVMPVERWLKED